MNVQRAMQCSIRSLALVVGGDQHNAGIPLQACVPSVCRATDTQHILFKNDLFNSTRLHY